jgi:hypothetical protein
MLSRETFNIIYIYILYNNNNNDDVRKQLKVQCVVEDIRTYQKNW